MKTAKRQKIDAFTEPQVVLFVINAQDPTIQKMKSGLERVLRSEGLRTQVVFIHDNASPPRMRELVDLWNPAGIVIAVGNMDVRNVRVPVVFLNTSGTGVRSNTVFHDSAEIGRLAAKELLSIDNTAFGCIAHPIMKLSWNRSRIDSFSNAIAMNGRPCLLHCLPSLEMKDRRMVLGLKSFLRSIEKPCGIFAVNDEIAALVIATATAMGFSVPEDISIVGVDNTTTFTESGGVPITSVVQDWELDGVLAGRMIIELIADSRRKCLSVCSPVLGVISRASTWRMARVDCSLVRKALAFIRDNACSGITSADVIRHMGCSRSLANLRFRESTGKSILETIHDVRFKTAVDLMANGRQSVQSVANRCGYRSVSFFRREFKRRMGVTAGGFGVSRANSLAE
ncbi:MAG: substrate-binding domain-containing protein [Kiritimatiellae bacterium]|nr:substrate-binding domain-containing protein [Kiritimatiellia bacterium]